MTKVSRLRVAIIWFGLLLVASCLFARGSVAAAVGPMPSDELPTPWSLAQHTPEGIAIASSHHGSFRSDASANAIAAEDANYLAAVSGGSFVSSQITDAGITLRVSEDLTAPDVLPSATPQDRQSAAPAVLMTSAVQRVQAAGVPVVVTHVPLSYRELETNMRHLASDPWLTEHNIKWASIKADPDTGLLTVALLKYDETVAQQLMTHYSSAVIEVAPGDHHTLQALAGGTGPSSDTFPWTAGDAIWGGAEYCTSGFSFGNQSNRDYVNTAAHCSSANGDTATSDSQDIGQVIDRTYDNGAHDSEMIPGLAQQAVWHAPEYGTGPRSLVTRVAQSDPGGGLICFDGSRSGYRCNITIDGDGMPACYSVSGVQTCGLVEASNAECEFAQPGDSGGPVETYLGNNTSMARGEIVANDLFDCRLGYYLPTRLTQDDYHLEVMMPIQQVSLAHLCIDVRNGATADYTPVQLSTCRSVAGQVWFYGSDLTIRALGKCLDVQHGSTAPDSKVDLYHCNGTLAQLWGHLDSYSDTQDYLFSYKSNLCLDDPKQSTTPGTQLQIHGCNYTVAQYWNLPNIE